MDIGMAALRSITTAGACAAVLVLAGSGVCASEVRLSSAGTSVPTQTATCDELAVTLASLEQERRWLQEELREARPSDKPYIIAEIRELTRQIDALRAQLGACR